MVLYDPKHRFYVTSQSVYLCLELLQVVLTRLMSDFCYLYMENMHNRGHPKNIISAILQYYFGLPRPLTSGQAFRKYLSDNGIFVSNVPLVFMNTVTIK